MPVTAISSLSTIAIITASTGLFLVIVVCRAELPWATITTSPTPAPTESTAISVESFGV
jgi:hypothetical protein